MNQFFVGQCRSCGSTVVAVMVVYNFDWREVDKVLECCALPNICCCPVTSGCSSVGLPDDDWDDNVVEDKRVDRFDYVLGGS